MDQPIFRFIDEAIKLELNMSRLYGIFAEYLDEDRHFWNRLVMEEKNHAALLKTAKDFISFSLLPKNILPNDIESLEESNRRVEETIDKFIKDPERDNAFTYALELEKSAGEIHFQNFMDERANDNITEIFQRLNRYDKDHAERIYNYWRQASPEK
jgi:hypothetical protein